MAKKFLTAIDLAKNELQNAVVQNLASAPSSPVRGQLYYDSTGGDETLYFYNGTTWISTAGSTLGTVTAQTTFGASSTNGAAATVSRSDHAHGTPAHDNTAHSAITLNSLAAPTADRSMGGFKITGLATPASATDAATMGYVDAVAAGLSWKDSVRAATTANITLSAPQTVDSVSVIAGDRVLVKDQTTGADNGIYVVAAGAWTRALDADSSDDLVGAAVFVSDGVAGADTGWVLSTNAPITVGSTTLAWVQFTGAGIVAGSGLAFTGNTLNIASGTGITVGADTVSADLTYFNANYATQVQVASLMDSFSENVAASTTSTHDHNYNTRDVHVQVYRLASPYDTVECDVERTTVNRVTLGFAVAPAANEYRVMIVGR